MSPEREPLPARLWDSDHGPAAERSRGASQEPGFTPTTLTGIILLFGPETVGPDKKGKISESSVKTLAEIGALISAEKE